MQERPDDLVTVAAAARAHEVTEQAIYYHGRQGRLAVYDSLEGPRRRLVSARAVAELRRAGWLMKYRPRVAVSA